MQDASAQNLDLSGNLDVSGNTTIGGTLSVTGNETVTGTLSVTDATTLSSLSVTGNETVGGTLSVTEATTLSTLSVSGNETVGGTLSVTEATTLSSLSVIGNETVGGTLSVTEATTLSSLSVIGNETVTGTLSVTDATTLSSLSVTGNETVGGTLGVTNTTTLTGNVGIGGASGSHNLLVTGSERVTGNLDVSGDLTITGNFNFSEVIQNITTVNNEVIISTQLDISNQGTGPALKVSQFGVGEDQDVAVFNAGDEGDAFKIDYAGNSHFYKEVDIVKEYDDVSFDTILIRRTDARAKRINLRTLQVYVNNSNILPTFTNATQSIESGSLGEVIEFMTWNDLIVRQRLILSPHDTYASNIRNNDIVGVNSNGEFSIHSLESSYVSLYIPLTQTINIGGVQSFVLYNRTFEPEKINGFQIELYNRSNGFTPGSNVLYTMPINTTANDYRFDFPSISSYSGGFSSVDSQTQIKTVTVSNSDENFNATLLKVEGGNVEFGGGLSVTGITTLSRLEMRQEKFDTILIRRTNSTSKYIYIRTLQVYVNNSNILPSATNATTSVGSGSIGDVIEFITWNDLVVRNSFINNSPEYYASNIRESDVGNPTSIHSTNPSYNSLYIPLIQSFNISDVQSFVLYNRNLDGNFLTDINGFQIELYNRSNGFTPGSNVLYTMPINTSAYVYRFDLPSISSYTGFSSVDSQTQIKNITVSASSQNLETTSFKVEDGDTEVGGDLRVGGDFIVDGSFNITGTIDSGNITGRTGTTITAPTITASVNLLYGSNNVGTKISTIETSLSGKQSTLNSTSTNIQTGTIDSGNITGRTGSTITAPTITASGNLYVGQNTDPVEMNMNQTFDTILIRRTDATGVDVNLRTLQVFVNGVNILPTATNSTTSIGSGAIGNIIEFMTWNDSVVSGSRNSASNSASNIRLNNVAADFSVHSLEQNTPYISLYIPLTQSFSISDVQSVVLYNRASGFRERINGFQIELYNRSSGFTPGINMLYTMPIDTTDYVYRFDLPSISSYTVFSSVDSTDKIKTVTVSSSYFNTTLLKVDGNVDFGGDLTVSGVINQTGASWSLGGFNNGVQVNLPYLVNSNIPFSVKQTPEVNCIYNTVDHNITIQKGGKYLVNYGAMSEINTTNIEIYLRKNGVNIYNVYSSTSSNSHRTAQGSILLDLDIGDIVSLVLSQGAMISNQTHRYFNGYLIG